MSAISLSTNSGLITACANDYDFKYIFKRQIEGLANKNDCILFISSGNSNLIEAAKYVKRKIYSIGLLGSNGGKLRKFCNLNYVVKSKSWQEYKKFIFFCYIIFAK